MCKLITETIKKNMESEKPKRQLTEAQRLAFLKAREKRLANIEKKRQEAAEKVEEATAPISDADEHKSVPNTNDNNILQPESPQEKVKQKRKYNRKPKEATVSNIKQEENTNENKHDDTVLQDETSTLDFPKEIKTEDEKKIDESEMKSISSEDMLNPFVIDHDLLAEKIAAKIKIPPPSPPVLKRSTNSTRQVKPKIESTTQKPQVIFNWM